jgi:hypothetical protein
VRLEPAALRELQQLANVQEDLLADDSRLQYRHLEKLLGGEDVTDRVLAAARSGQHGKVDSTTDNGPNLEQVKPDCFIGVACDIDSPYFERYRRNWTIMRHQHEIMMGTRGDPFTTGRIGGDQALQKAVKKALGGLASVGWAGDGSSYRSHSEFWHSEDIVVTEVGGTGTFGHTGVALYPRLMPTSPMSDDHGELTVRAPGCSASFMPAAFLRNGAEPEMNVHTWGNADGTVVRHCLGERSATHALPDLGERHAWPMIIDYNDSVPSGILPNGMVHGQPTHAVELTRDTRDTEPDPWDLKFTWAGKLTYDTRVRGVSHARAKAIAYYHRGDQWDETPNFVNPFWQATLISARDENGR